VNELSRTDVLIDANLLILLVVGLVDPKQVSHHKNTAHYSPGDFKLLTNLLASARTIVITPNVATEASNLLRQTHAVLSKELGQVLSSVLEKTREVPVASVDATRDAAFLRLGLTDAAILTVLPNDLALLTDDGGLYAAATQRRLQAVKFSHRQAAGA